jgi:hypothetical protein
VIDRNFSHLPSKRWVTLGPDRTGGCAADTNHRRARKRGQCVHDNNTRRTDQCGAPADAKTVEPISCAEELNDEIKC